MLVLFFKATSNAGRHRSADKELPADKMRRILEAHVAEAETSDERARAERELDKFLTFPATQESNSL